MRQTKRSVGINAIFNVVKTLMNIVFPLITFPYVTRVLGVDNLGKVNYSQSIVSYFSLVGALGISTYAIREGAQLKESQEKIIRFSNEVFTINLFTTAIAYILEIIIVFVCPRFKGYRGLIFLLSSSIIFTTIGIDWVNSIYEDFLYITIRSISVQILNLALLYIVVRSKQDYYIYAFLIVFTQIVTCVLNFFYCRKFIQIKPILNFVWKSHIKQMLVLFANNMAVTIYCSADATMLGLMVGDYYVGIYVVAVKVYSMIRSLLAAAFAVCIPRLSSYLGCGDVDSFKALINKISYALVLVIMPSIVGIVFLAEPIVLILGGEEYIEAVITLQILSFALVFAIVGGLLTNCINIPLRKEGINLKATVIGALLNVALNLRAIPLWKQNGAAITTVLSEACVVLICLFSSKRAERTIDTKVLLIAFKNAIVGTIPVAIWCYFVPIFFDNVFVVCGISVGISALIYIAVLIVVKDRIAIYILKMMKM